MCRLPVSEWWTMWLRQWNLLVSALLCRPWLFRAERYLQNASAPFMCVLLLAWKLGFTSVVWVVGLLKICICIIIHANTYYFILFSSIPILKPLPRHWIFIICTELFHWLRLAMQRHALVWKMWCSNHMRQRWMSKYTQSSSIYICPLWFLSHSCEPISSLFAGLHMSLSMW